MKDDVRDFAKLAKRQRQLLASQIDALYAKQNGEFSNETIVDGIAAILSGHDLNQFRVVLARKIAEAEDNSRRAVPIPSTIEMFSDELLAANVVAIGGGLRVTLRDVTFKHMLKKQEQQREAIKAATTSADNFSELVDTVRPLMEPDPDMTLRQCLMQLGAIKKSA